MSWCVDVMYVLVCGCNVCLMYVWVCGCNVCLVCGCNVCLGVWM